MIIKEEVLPMLDRMFKDIIDSGLDGFNQKKVKLSDLSGLDILPKITKNIKEKKPTSQWLVHHATALSIILESKYDSIVVTKEFRMVEDIMNALVTGTNRKVN